MKNDSKLSFLLIFCFSCIILTLQVYLSALLRTYLKLPFLSISFAFLGISAAGVYSYIRFSVKKKAPALSSLAKYLDIFGALLLLYFVFLFPLTMEYRINYFLNLTADGNLPFLKLLKIIFMDNILQSFFIGFYFSACFFFIGLGISVLYRLYSQQAEKIYFFDLLGATAGCILGAAVMNFSQFSSTPVYLSLISFLSAFLIRRRYPSSRISRKISLFCIMMAVSIIFINSRTNFLEFKMMNLLYKEGEQQTPLEEVWSGWNSYSQVSLLKKSNPSTRQDEYVFSIDNGKGYAYLDAFDPADPYQFKLFDGFHAVTLAYLLKQPQDLLIMFTGSGRDMIKAYSFSNGQSDITGVELNPLIVDTALKYPAFHLKEFFALPNVHMVNQEGRSYLESHDKRYDAVIYSWAGASVESYLGTSAYTAQYLNTKEAFISLLRHLTPDGTIGIVDGNKARYCALWMEVFAELGLKDVGRHIVIIADKDKIENGSLIDQIRCGLIDVSRIIFKNSPFTPAEIAVMDTNIKKMGMDWVYSPTYVHPDFQFIKDLLHDKNPGRFVRDYGLENYINLEPPTDDKPFITNIFYIYNFFSASFWSKVGHGFITQYTAHCLVHFYALAVFLCLLLIGFFFILLPLIRSEKKEVLLKENIPFLYYFSALGLGFILIEISVMNQFVLFLGNPIYSFTVILASLLLSTGLGAYLSDFLFNRWRILNIKKAAGLCSVLLAVYFLKISTAVHAFLGLPVSAKLILSFLLILPLGLMLGIFFPQGIKKLGESKPELIPWAWALNGYMSVIGSSFSIYLSIVLGFNMFILLAAFIYLSLCFLPMDV